MIVGLLFRHIKCYHGLKYLPFTNAHNFVSFVGNNGVGKSTILEAIDYFFYEQDWSINKGAVSSGGFKFNSYPFVSPVFVIKKDEIDEHNILFEKLNNFFRKAIWTIKTEEVKKDYDKHIGELSEMYPEDKYYLFTIGITDKNKKVYFGSFSKELYVSVSEMIPDYDASIKTEDTFEPLDKIFHKVLEVIYQKYTYLYFPVEISYDEVTKLQATEMQGLMSKDIREDIFSAIGGDISIKKINDSLNKLVDEINNSMDGYEYGTINSLKNLQKNDLIDKILESYFSKRILKSIVSKVSIDRFSSGEKRRALIDLAKFFLSNGKELGKKIILAIDEPESSLHMNACFSQFESLKNISKKNQVFITTHWYGFLPIVSEGNAHFINKIKNEIHFDSYDLFNIFHDIKNKKEKTDGDLPFDTALKSTNDLVQSIYYSLQGDDTYNWLICEGITEKIYFEYFFSELLEKNALIVLPLAGTDKVRKLYSHLTPALENFGRNNSKKVFFLVDTDKDKDYATFHISNDGNVRKIAMFKRLHNSDMNLTTFVDASNTKNIHPTEIENSLVPEIFLKTLMEFPEELNELDINLEKFDDNKSKNTDFSYGFNLSPSESQKLKAFFDLDKGNMKIRFAYKYVEISIKNGGIGIPVWIEKEFGEFYKN